PRRRAATPRRVHRTDLAPRRPRRSPPWRRARLALRRPARAVGVATRWPHQHHRRHPLLRRQRAALGHDHPRNRPDRRRCSRPRLADRRRDRGPPIERPADRSTRRTLATSTLATSTRTRPHRATAAARGPRVATTRYPGPVG